MHDINGSAASRSLSERKHRPSGLQAHVAYITFGAQDQDGGVKIVRAPVQDTISSLLPISAIPTRRWQARWIHLPANCMSWAEVRIRYDLLSII
jgi:hypothetical protein